MIEKARQETIATVAADCQRWSRVLHRSVFECPHRIDISIWCCRKLVRHRLGFFSDLRHGNPRLHLFSSRPIAGLVYTFCKLCKLYTAIPREHAGCVSPVLSVRLVTSLITDVARNALKIAREDRVFLGHQKNFL